MLQECLLSDCQRKLSMDNFKKERAVKVVKRNDTKTPLKPRLRTSIFQLSPGNRLHRTCPINKGATQCEAKRMCEAEKSAKNGKQ